jgi:hypothetical protein
MSSTVVKFATILLLCLLPAAGSSQQGVANAQAFDAKTIPIEFQAWWFPAFGHIHAAARLPIGQTVSGKLNLGVRIVIHNNPSKVVRVYATSDDDLKFTTNTSLVCPYDGVHETNCAFSVPLPIDTTLMKDGWRELRIKANATTPDAKAFRVSSSMAIYVDNGKTDVSYSKFTGTLKPLSGVAYYTGVDYTYAKIEDVPRTPISGVYTFRVHTADGSSHLTIDLDKGHYIPAVGSWPEQPASAGVTLFDQEGRFSSTVKIPVDTRNLANGWHTFAAKSIGVGAAPSFCSYCGPELSKLAGVSKIWFYVNN